MATLAGSAEGTFVLASRVDEILSRRPAVGFAVGAMRNGRLEKIRGA